MDYGIVLPHFTAFAKEDPAHRIVTAAETAEALGYSTVWVADHVVFPAKIEGDTRLTRMIHFSTH